MFTIGASESTACRLMSRPTMSDIATLANRMSGATGMTSSPIFITPRTFDDTRGVATLH
jgi:hypothetical protein